MPRVLVACPTCEGKDYALEEWWGAYQSFTWPDRQAFMADNTGGTLSYTHRLRKLGIPADHVEPLGDFWDTMELSWRLIVERALLCGCRYVASIEADVVCPPEALDVLLEHAGGHRVVAHWYPDRESGTPIASIGCALIETDWLAATVCDWWQSAEDEIMGSGRNFEIRDRLIIRHLDG